MKTLLLIPFLLVILTACNDEEGSSTKTIEIQRIEYAPSFDTITPSYSLTQGGSSSITVPSCVDPETSNTLTYSITSNLSQGILSNCLNSDTDRICDIDFSGVSGFVGTDSFTYKCNNGKDDSTNTKTINIVVSAPAPTPPSGTSPQTYTKTIGSTTLNNLYNSIEVEASGTRLYFTSYAQNGTLQLFVYNGTSVSNISSNLFHEYHFKPNRLIATSDNNHLFFVGNNASNQNSLFHLEISTGTITEITSSQFSTDSPFYNLRLDNADHLTFYKRTSLPLGITTATFAYNPSTKTVEDGIINYTGQDWVSENNELNTSNYLINLINNTTSLYSMNWIFKKKINMVVNLEYTYYFSSTNTRMVLNQMASSSFNPLWAFNYNTKSKTQVANVYRNNIAFCGGNIYYINYSNSYYELHRLAPDLTDTTIYDGSGANEYRAYNYTMTCAGDKLVYGCRDMTLGQYGICTYNISTGVMNKYGTTNYYTAFNKTHNQLLLTFATSSMTQYYTNSDIVDHTTFPITSISSTTTVGATFYLDFYYDTSSNQWVMLENNLSDKDYGIFVQKENYSYSVGVEYKGINDWAWFNNQIIVSGKFKSPDTYHATYRPFRNENEYTELSHIWILDTSVDGGRYIQWTP